MEALIWTLFALKKMGYLGTLFIVTWQTYSAPSSALLGVRVSTLTDSVSSPKVEPEPSVWFPSSISLKIIFFRIRLMQFL